MLIGLVCLAFFILSVTQVALMVSAAFRSLVPWPLALLLAAPILLIALWFGAVATTKLFLTALA